MRLVLAFLVALFSGCSPTGETPREGFDPSGYYAKEEGRYVFRVWRTPKGAWAIETQGIPPPTSPANSCWTVSVGSMHGGRLVSSSDLNLDFAATLSESNLRHGGTIVDFSESSATLNIESSIGCDLDGTYERRDSEDPHIRKYRDWAFPEGSESAQPGPILGDPNVRFGRSRQ